MGKLKRDIFPCWKIHKLLRTTLCDFLMLSAAYSVGRGYFSTTAPPAQVRTGPRYEPLAVWPVLTLQIPCSVHLGYVIQ